MANFLLHVAGNHAISPAVEMVQASSGWGGGVKGERHSRVSAAWKPVGPMIKAIHMYIGTSVEFTTGSRWLSTFFARYLHAFSTAATSESWPSCSGPRDYVRGRWRHFDEKTSWRHEVVFGLWVARFARYPGCGESRRTYMHPGQGMGQEAVLVQGFFTRVMGRSQEANAGLEKLKLTPIGVRSGIRFNTRCATLCPPPTPKQTGLKISGRLNSSYVYPPLPLLHPQVLFTPAARPSTRTLSMPGIHSSTPPTEVEFQDALHNIHYFKLIH